MAEKWGQQQLFESVTDDERLAVKDILKHYPKLRVLVETLSRRSSLTSKQQDYYNRWGSIVSEIETAFNLIIDPEVKASYNFV